MSSTEYVTFKIDGEWLTNFFRRRFWNEDCGYEKAIDLIQNSLSADISEEMCIALLEGRKKLVGTNAFVYVDDNENVRPISLYIKKRDEEIRINLIAERIKTYPYIYIDQYACNTSREWWITPKQRFHWNITQWFIALAIKRGNPNDVLRNGCIWLENPEATARMLMRHTDNINIDNIQFADIVFAEYEDHINLLRERKIPFSELSDYEQAIVARNHHYVSSKNFKAINKIEWDYLGERTFTLNRWIREEEKKRLQEEDEKIKELANQQITKRVMEDLKNRKTLPVFNSLIDNSDFDTTPITIDNIQPGWEGYVDRDGNFYQTKPTGNGWYKGSANCHRDWAVQYLKEQNIETNMDAKDYLIYELGWCDYAHFFLLGTGANVQYAKKFSKEQEKTLLKLFEINNDNIKYLQELFDGKHRLYPKPYMKDIYERYPSKEN